MLSNGECLLILLLGEQRTSRSCAVGLCTNNLSKMGTWKLEALRVKYIVT